MIYVVRHGQTDVNKKVKSMASIRQTHSNSIVMSNYK
ncbi:Uncharacterised protein [Paenibacillus thiaminolyticus]|nr:Uncharacterised protein [Paenibacillus thiaminolyticus]